MSVFFGRGRNGDNWQYENVAFAWSGRGDQHSTGMVELGHRWARGGELGAFCK